MNIIVNQMALLYAQELYSDMSRLVNDYNSKLKFFLNNSLF